MAKKTAAPKRISNRRASYDYDLGDSLVVGLQLTGAETKALRLGHGQLRGSFVAPKGEELWLVNSQIMGSRGVPIDEDQVSRSRKVLAKRKEIDKMLAARQAGNTIVPLELLTRGRYIKMRIAVGRGKKRYDKRETIKRREQEREATRTIK
jgi:SsrA-binding protein